MQAPLLLVAALMLLGGPRPSAAALSDVVGAVKSIFGGEGGSAAPSNMQQQLGPIVVKSATALAYAVAGGGAGGALQLPAGPANVTLHRAGPHSLVIAFSVGRTCCQQQTWPGSASGSARLSTCSSPDNALLLPSGRAEHRPSAPLPSLPCMQDERGPANWAVPVTDGSPGGSGNVSFLADWVYTSQAPLQLLDAFGRLVEGPGTQGTLADVSWRGGPCLP